MCWLEIYFKEVLLTLFSKEYVFSEIVGLSYFQISTMELINFLSPVRTILHVLKIIAVGSWLCW